MQADFFAANRRRLCEVIGEGIVVVTAYTQLQRSNDTAFRFEQEANFWWLTGIEAPDWNVIIDASRGQAWLVMPEVDDVHALFDGSLSAEVAQQQSGVEQLITMREAEALLRELAARQPIAWTIGADARAEHYDFVVNPALAALEQRLKGLFGEVRSLRRELARLRAIKQPAEIAAMERAIGVTVDAFEAVRSQLSTFQHEYEVEAEFSYLFRRHGAPGHAYDPIVAGGGRACTLHYTVNNQPLQAGELLLLDIGARVSGYAADITRTYAFGEPTSRQRAVHAAVQQAHQEIIRLLEPGLSVRAYHDRVDDIMKRALVELGLMRDETDDASYRQYFPHAISHGLGVDVHDSLGGPDVLMEGMVLTVEPGIYIPEEAIGVRIEDDILITANSARNLSAALSTDLT